MPKFSLEQKMPSCFVSRELLTSIETFLKTELPTKFGDSLGEDVDYKISIKEKIGTETLAAVSDYSPANFSDGTTAIEIRWSNGYRAGTRLDILVDFDREYYLSQLKIDCTASTARETAKGVADSILRLVDSHRTQNWIFNPFKYPLTVPIATLLSFVLLAYAIVGLVLPSIRSWYFLAAAAAMLWIALSAHSFRPYISFDTHRQRVLNRIWIWFSLGVLGFIIFGTALPLLRKGLFGF